MSVQQNKRSHLHLDTTQKMQPYRRLVTFKTLAFRNNTENITIQNTTNIRHSNLEITQKIQPY